MLKAVTRRLAAAAVVCAFAGSGTAFAGTGTRTSSFAYDPTSGLLTQEVVEPGTPSLRLETDYSYDAFGNKVSATVSGIDIVSRSSGSTYDSQGQFVSSNTNAASIMIAEKASSLILGNA